MGRSWVGNYNGSDAFDSDDPELAAALRLSLQRSVAGSSTRENQAGPSTSKEQQQPSYARRQELNSRIAAYDAELKEIDTQIDQLRKLRQTIVSEKKCLVDEVGSLGKNRTQSAASSSKNGGKLAAAGTINYMDEIFDWSEELKEKMRKVFGIQNFRLCQEGVCNANMDGRDIVCIMPTGGGKSLTYQLPALLNPGCTLVISPLISLITDQILHLREFGVEAVMLTGSTSKEESRDIFSRLAATAGARSRFAEQHGVSGPEIKLCYVTPEKIAKSKMFMSMLEKLANAGKLARIVIDEAHCVSQLGHDFRPDYKKLSILRQLFPRVPILALSATCPPKVLKDLIFTLRLKPVVPGTAASVEGTVHFTAPLYRKNLHYKVLPKPNPAAAAIDCMTQYILENHPRDSGIIYCLSKKDAEAVAQGLIETSKGKIRTGVYHADVHDGEKENLHRRWRVGDIKVVCATIAFGLGIDKGDVRFVLHHSMSKSLEGYYQESGRAGRDGKDSDCILYYRSQDAARLSALVCGEVEGQDKLHDMLRFAQDIEECRKLQFARYFSMSTSLSMSAWGDAESDALSRCGHCDNCSRPPESIEHRDVTMVAWQILMVMQSIERDGGRVTLGMLADLVRGSGGGAYGANVGGKRGKGKAKEKVELDLDGVAGGKVQLSKDDTESLLVNLLLKQYLKESFHSTAYSINVYVLLGPNAIRLSRLSREDIEQGKRQRMVIPFAKKAEKKGRSASNKQASSSRDKPLKVAKGGKQNLKEMSTSSNGVDYNHNAAEDSAVMDLFIDDDEVLMDEVKDTTASAIRTGKRKRAQDVSESDDEESWSFSMAKLKSNSKSGTSAGDGIKSRQTKRLRSASLSPPVSVIEIFSDSE